MISFETRKSETFHFVLCLQNYFDCLDFYLLTFFVFQQFDYDIPRCIFHFLILFIVLFDPVEQNFYQYFFFKFFPASFRLRFPSVLHVRPLETDSYDTDILSFKNIISSLCSFWMIF